MKSRRQKQKEKKERERFLGRLGEHIARVRKSKAYSQDRLYLEAGFSRANMSQIEAGQVDVQIFTLARIANTIGVPLRRLTDISLEDLESGEDEED